MVEPRDDSDLTRRLDDLAARLSAIEDRIGMPRPARPAAPATPPPAAQPSAPPTAPPVAHQAASPVASPPPIVDLDELSRRRKAERETEESAAFACRLKAFGEVTGGRPAQSPVFVAPPPVAPPAPPAKPKEPFNIERFIGTKVVPAVGVPILVVGTAFLLKWAVDERWLTVSNTMRCIGAAAFGLALIGAGEFIRRKWGALAAMGLSAAGIAVTYAAVFAAFAWYELLSPAPAFAMLVGVSAIGIGVALRAKSIAVAALALIAAYLTPIAIGDHDSSPLIMPCYLFALLVLGLFLAAWRPQPFRMLRQFVWWGTVVLGTAWIIQAGFRHTEIVLCFLGAVWIAMHAEMLLGSRRVGESAQVAWAPRSVQKRITRPIILSFASTAWATTVGVLVVQNAPAGFPIPDWTIPAAGVVGTLVLAMILAGNLRVFQDAPETDAERLGASHWMQAAGLLITATALGVPGSSAALAWLGMGVAAIAAGRWLRARPLDVYGLILLTLAVGRLLVFESWKFGPGTEFILGFAMGPWAFFMAAAGASWLAASWLLWHPSGPHRATGCAVPPHSQCEPPDASDTLASVPSHVRVAVSNLCIGIGLSIAYAGLLWPSGYAVSMVSAAAVLGLAVLGGAFVRKSMILEVWGVVVLAAASLVATQFQLDVFIETKPLWSFAIGGAAAGELIFTKWSIVLVTLAAAWAIGAVIFDRFKRPTPLPEHVASVMCLVAKAMALMLATLAPATHIGAVCVLWTAMACALLAKHAFLKRFHQDKIALGVLGASVAAWAWWYIAEHPWFSIPAAAAGALAHPGMWIALAIVAVLLVASWWLGSGWHRRPACDGNLRDQPNAAALPQPGLAPTPLPWLLAARALAVLLLFAATSLEVSRSAGIMLPSDHTAQAGALSIWWAVFAVAMIVAGFVLRTPIVRHIGLGLLNIAAVKAIILDLAALELGWRGVSLVLIGGMMLGVAVAYAKVSKKVSSPKASSIVEPPSSKGYS